MSDPPPVFSARPNGLWRASNDVPPRGCPLDFEPTSAEPQVLWERDSRINLTAEDTSAGLLADVGPGAPPLQLVSLTCPREPGGTLVIGLLTDEVADVRFYTPRSWNKGCRSAGQRTFPSRVCLFLLDGVGERAR
jgi:hypothetical protein